MGFKKFSSEVTGKIKDAYHEYQEKKRIEREQEEERLRQLKKEKDNIEKLLDKFEFPDLEELCSTYLGHKPTGDIEEDEDEEGHKIQKVLKPNRRNYLDFIWENLKDDELKPTQIKDFALKKPIVSPSFFGLQTSSEQVKREFENIINTIAQFQPEKATLEKEHFQPQLFVYLKAKYPDKKIEREVPTKNNQEFLDIVIDDKYVLELKVYSDRSQLRALGAQLEEYKEKYPYVCAVILDNENSESSKVNIKEYTDKYKVRNNVPCVILSG